MFFLVPMLTNLPVNRSSDKTTVKLPTFLVQFNDHTHRVCFKNNIAMQLEIMRQIKLDLH